MVTRYKRKIRPEEEKATEGQKKQIGPKKFVEQWNNVCPIGTIVTWDFYDMNGKPGRGSDRSGNRAAVFMKVYNGFF